jgi:hypothetical protein
LRLTMSDRFFTPTNISFTPTNISAEILRGHEMGEGTCHSNRLWPRSLAAFITNIAESDFRSRSAWQEQV